MSVIVDMNEGALNVTVSMVEDGQNPHKKPITKIEISPTRKFLVTYSKDEGLIVGWNADCAEGSLLPETFVKVTSDLGQICVSDDKMLVFIYTYKDWNNLKIINMNNADQKIELDINKVLYPYYCGFNLNNELILCGNIKNKNKKLDDARIWIYPAQSTESIEAEEVKWTYQRIFEIPKELKIISKEDNKLYLLSYNFVYEWNIITGKAISIITINELNVKESDIKDIKITSNENFICLKIKSEIIIYSIVLKIPIIILSAHDDIQLRDIIGYPLLPSFSSLLDYTSKIWNFIMECRLAHLNYKTDDSVTNIQAAAATNYVFGILDGCVWKIKFETDISFSGFKPDKGLNNDEKLFIPAYKQKLILSSGNTLYTPPQASTLSHVSSSQSTAGLESDTQALIEMYEKTQNYDRLKLDELVTSIKGHKESFMKDSVRLLNLAIKKHDIALIDGIYENCLSYFEEDGNNRMILGIIVSTMPELNEFYPDFVKRYSHDTNVITDTPYSVVRQGDNVHLHSFTKDPKIIKPHLFDGLFLFLSLFNKLFLFLLDKTSQKKSAPTLSFIVPFVKFVSYPPDYDYLKDWASPQTSPFADTINRDIYSTWNGEAVINFKWNKFGKYYYYGIWMAFNLLLVCFTIAAVYQALEDDVRKVLLIFSILLGTIHLLFEVRQCCHNPMKWLLDPWNWFDILAYILPICTSIYWLVTNEKNDQTVQLLSFSCLFLDLKFLLFFRSFESFGVYFAIIISVAKQIFYFLIVLLIILTSFAHAFYILLTPRSDYSFQEAKINEDFNNPWSMSPTYKILEGTDELKQIIVQQPDENTNMFIDYGTALFAVYLSLAGDPSALSHWPYKNHPSLMVLIVLFSFLIIVYLMNLFIGLLNMAIEKDNNRVSYLLQKAENLAEIELFYLLPHQRRWQSWFPEIIYYYADVDKTRDKVKEMIANGEWNDKFPNMKKDLLEKLNIQHNPVDKTILLKLLKEHKKNLNEEQKQDVEEQEKTTVKKKQKQKQIIAEENITAEAAEENIIAEKKITAKEKITAEYGTPGSSKYKSASQEQQL